MNDISFRIRKRKMATEDNLGNYENKENEGLDKTYNLENKEDIEKLESEMSSDNYFKPEEGISYKIKLTSPQIREVQRTFDDDIVTKYELGIKVKGSDGSEFEGTWEVGRTVLEPIMKNYESGAVYNVSRTGTGKKTRYSVTKDFS
jgi:hypothetical protein